MDFFDFKIVLKQKLKFLIVVCKVIITSIFAGINKIIYIFSPEKTKKSKSLFLVNLAELKRHKAEKLLTESLVLSKKAQSFDPEGYNTNCNLAFSYLSKGLPVEAWVYATKALGINPKKKRLWDFLYQIATKSHGLLQSLLQTYHHGRIAYPEIDFFREDGFYARQKKAIELGIPPLLINTQAKSGTIYIRSKIGKGLNVPWCRLTVTPLDNEPIQSWVESFAKGGAICGEHLFATDTTIARLQKARINKIVIHARDPRAAAFSMMHFRKKQSKYASLISSAIGDHHGDASMDDKFKTECSMFIPNWVEWLNSWLELDKSNNSPFSLLFTEYSDFKFDEISFIKRILQFYDIDISKFNFDVSLSNSHEVHFRSGQLDEWRKLVSEETADYVWSLMDEEQCYRFGWEK